ncbi:Alpha-2C adrenergic receptor [Portunus trituberculatus]|uniref:Alpha-2C adrenergic receptor n=1 Tax=Portunus trituberculatus TaxID=210409 RepID=A0A5B7CXI8_PORTR|nr:Alpha-2C adrenergic receptor [Portunus trituberculatus]
MDDMSDNLTARGEDDAEGFLDHVGVGRGRMQDMNGSVTAWNGTVWVYPWGASLYPSRYTTVEVAVITTLVTAAMMVVVVGNMLVIVAIATEKTLNSLTNWFIASLAVADLLLGLLIMPFSLANLLMGYWVFGDLWCELHAAIDVLLSTASINNICLISLDRYWSITRTVDYMKKRTPQRAIAMIVFVWVFSGLVSIPPLLGWKQTRPQDLFPKCTVSFTGWRGDRRPGSSRRVPWPVYRNALLSLISTIFQGHKDD